MLLSIQNTIIFFKSYNLLIKKKKLSCLNQFLFNLLKIIDICIILYYIYQHESI